MASEELIVRELAKGFKITVHATACAGLRSCEALCDGAEFQYSKEGEGADCRKLCVPRSARLQCLGKEADGFWEHLEAV